MPKALLVYPEFPPSFWSAKYALEFVGRKAAMPPLGLLTIAAMFPSHWILKLVDLNVEALRDEDLRWAECVFCSGMLIQRSSFQEIVRRCRQIGVPVIAGGPYATSFPEELGQVDHIVAGEVEDTFRPFLAALENQKAPRAWGNDCVAGSSTHPEMFRSPVPRYDLIDPRKYDSAALQFSRGCPWNCEFCDVTRLFGRYPRTKSTFQMMAEIEALYRWGWRNSLFLVDDNFIGNRKKALEFLKVLAPWQKARGYPFSFYTEATVSLSEMPDLLDAMVEAGFSMVFLGIETPRQKALLKAGKSHNIREGQPDYLLKAIRKIQSRGLEVSGGFILGLDGEDRDAAQALFDFIQEAGIPSAMVGLLTAFKGTDLYERLKREGRLLSESTGDNLSVCLNFVPESDRDTLVRDYKDLLCSLYQPTLSNYFRRCYTFFKSWRPGAGSRHRVLKADILALCKSILRQGFSRQGPAYFLFLAKVIINYPKHFPDAVRLSIMGYHYQKISSQLLAASEFNLFLEKELAVLRRLIVVYASVDTRKIGELNLILKERFAKICQRYQRANQDLRAVLKGAIHSFERSIDKCVEEYGGGIGLRIPRIDLQER